MWQIIYAAFIDSLNVSESAHDLNFSLTQLLVALDRRAKELKFFYGGNTPMSLRFNEGDATYVKEIYDVYYDYFNNLWFINGPLMYTLKNNTNYLYMTDVVTFIVYVR